jgi:hypothetical protein
MEKAATRAEELGRHHLADVLRQQIADYQNALGMEVVYDDVRNAVWCEPDVTLPQIKRWVANDCGLLVSEVSRVFRRIEKVFHEAKKDALEDRALKERFRRQAEAND